jgi:small subunit ribosomal protein S1
MVLELDAENRRLALGHKQLEENPWDTFETIFTRSSVHKCSILSKTDKGAVLELPYGIEGFATIKNLVKEDGTQAEAGETLDFRVTEFSKEDKRIVLSHTAVYQEDKQKDQKKKKPAQRGSTVSKINQEVEKSTLGDLEALSILKEQMEEEQKTSLKAKLSPKKTQATAGDESPESAAEIQPAGDEEAKAEEKPKKVAKTKAKPADSPEEE